MALSIHYSGNITKPELLPVLISEIKEIAEVHKYSYEIFEQSFPEDAFSKETYNDKIYGIYLGIPKCEPVWFCFLSNGRISSPANLKVFGNSKSEKEKQYVYQVSVKTQFAGIEAHKFIVNLFKYVSNKYYTGFEFIDEGQYWETDDEEVLKKNFDKFNSVLNTFTEALKKGIRDEGETLEAYIKRIAQDVYKNLKE